jgi:hypothetical protein
MVVNLGVLLLRGELRITVYFLYLWPLSVIYRQKYIMEAVSCLHSITYHLSPSPHILKLRRNMQGGPTAAFGLQ